MMVTYVRGHFKNIHGRLNFDPTRPQSSAVELEIDARTLWTGEPDRDAHLRRADFLDVEHHPSIRFRSREVKLLGDHDYSVEGDLTIRGVSCPCKLRASYLGQWQTPWWENGVDKGPQNPRRLHSHDYDKPPRFRRKLERAAGPGRDCRRRSRRNHHRC